MSASGPDDAALIERLRAEAIRSRPAFDVGAAERVLAAVRGTARPRRGGHAARTGVACLMFMGAVCGAAVWWGDRSRPVAGGVEESDRVALATAVAGLDALPTLDEFGGDVVGGIGSLAATVVGLPDWRELAVAELPLVDGWGLDGAAGADASADPGPPR